MEADRSELRDLSSQWPELVEELACLWQQWASRCQVMPWGGLQALRRRRRAQGGD
jgi:arylsulfatase